MDIKALWKARFGTEAPVKLADNETLRLQYSHHSVRQYQTRPVPEEMLLAGLGAASSSSTSINYQIWSAIVVTDQAKRDRLVELCGGQKHIAQAPVFIAWVIDQARLKDIADMHSIEHESLDYFETFLTGAIDVGIASQNANIAFESMGLGTLFVGGLRNHPEEVAKLLDLPERSVAILGMCVGFKADNAVGGIKPRLGQDVVVKDDHYVKATKEQIKQYDEIASQYQVSQGLPPRSWSKTVSSRLSSVKNIDGRDVIRKTLNKMGFALK